MIGVNMFKSTPFIFCFETGVNERKMKECPLRTRTTYWVLEAMARHQEMGVFLWFSFSAKMVCDVYLFFFGGGVGAQRA